MKPKKLFICDDERSIVDLLKSVFEEFTDFEVLTETRSSSAYARIKAERADILIVDLSMPELTGDALIEQIRSKGEIQGLYIICISANRNGRDVAMAAGADIFLAKPFDLDDIISAAQRAAS